MKIGIDMRCFAGGRHSGVEEYTRQIVERLVESLPNVRFVLFYNAFSGDTPDFSWVTKYERVTLKRTHFPNKLLHLSLWYLKRPYLDRLVGGVDVFFAPNINFLSISRKCRFIITAHDLTFEVYPETFSWKRRLWHVFVSPRSLFRRADRIISVSYSTADDLHSYYKLSKKKIFTIHSGVSDYYSPMDRNAIELIKLKEKYQLPYRFILFVGTFEPRKNISALVRGYEVFRKKQKAQQRTQIVPLIIAGSPGWKEDELENEIRTNVYRSDIRRIGKISESEKRQLYNLATVFVYPSLYEGFGFPVAEAMACGVPVITSNGSSLAEIAGKGAILIDPLRPDEIGIALDELFRDIELRYEMSNRARLVASRLSWRETAKETKNVLTKWGNNE